MQDGNVFPDAPKTFEKSVFMHNFIDKINLQIN